MGRKAQLRVLEVLLDYLMLSTRPPQVLHFQACRRHLTSAGDNAKPGCVILPQRSPYYRYGRAAWTDLFSGCGWPVPPRHRQGGVHLVAVVDIPRLLRAFSPRPL